MINPPLQLTSNSQLADEYRRLLRRDWDHAAFEAMIALVNRQLPPPTDAASLAFDGTLFDPRHNPHEPIVVNEQLHALLSAYSPALLGAYTTSLLPNLPSEIRLPKEKTPKKLSERAFHVSALLVLPARRRLEGNVELFLDSLSLLYLAASHFLCPKLKENDLREQKALLANAMWLHCQTVWVTELPHQQYLLACLFHFLDLHDQEQIALKNAFFLTETGDHDFLSKAQAVWDCLLQQKRPEDARTFILQATRRAAETALVELSEMLGDTFASVKSA